jgi:DNA-binding NarL/FixJ family response regulator
MPKQPYGDRVPSKVQLRVIALVAEGLKNREIAARIGTTEHVVKNYLRIVYDKLGLWNRVELALWYEARKHESRIVVPKPGRIRASRGTEI